MLEFDIRSVEAKAVQVNAELSPDDPIWKQGDPVPQGPLRVTGRLSAAGAGKFYWHGNVSGDVTMPCRRCLADATVHVQDDAHVIFAEAGSEETEDPDVYELAERASRIDLRPALREQWMLNVPSFVECREDCKGLCPACGEDLNEGPCECPPSRDARWDALRRIQTEN